MQELQRAVELDPSLGDAAANLASFLIEQKQLEEALRVLNRALVYSGVNARLYYNLGVVLQTQGNRAGAMKAYENAINLDPTYARPMNNLATLYVETRRLDDAVALLARVVALEPGNERAHYNLGIAYREKGDVKAAASEFTAALRIRPDYTDANRALTRLFNPSAGQP